MLESLHIKNLALFTEQHLDFSSGLNTVSGETGAGKSLVIGAIQLLSGMRASSAIIRRGSTSCEVSAVFNLSSLFPALQERVNFLLEEAALPPCEDKRLLIRRSINENGSRAFVNSSAVTAAFLRELTEFLIDIHGPNDNQSLLKQSKQLQILDSFAKEQKNLQSCKKIWLDLQETRTEYEELQKENIAPEEIQLYKYQLQEIQDAQIKVDEEEELLARHKIVANSKRMLEIASDCAEGI
jgi:DNA repair protein RecN (Recombination protein N)